MVGEAERAAFNADFMRAAYEQALKSFNEGGVPVGAALADGDRLLALGHNQRVQKGDPTAHGEMDCIRAAGRRPGYGGLTLYTTLSPCMMCSGTIIQFGIRDLIVGEATNFAGDLDFLRGRGVRVTLVDDPDCTALMARFIAEKPSLWHEDIAEEE